MPIDANELRTGGALQGVVAASLLRQREQAAELLPGAQLGKYRILRELGRGGMAIVYLAERADGEYEQHVALKWMLQSQPDAISADQFRRERQALADLRHPHIARLIDGGRGGDGRPWFAMDLVEGGRLDRHCVRHGLSLRDRLSLLLQVCAAVAHAHARGLIHRDIKPSNVLADANGDAKLLDFGIAQLLGQDDGSAKFQFTPGFASPEQVRGEPVTIAGDVYQLGRLLISMVCSPEEEEAIQATLRLDVTAPGGSGLQTQFSGLPGDLAAIIGMATASDPQDRYSSVNALAEDVCAFLDRRPVRALPRRPIYVAVRYVQRHPFGVAWVTFAIFLLLMTSAFFTWRLRAERDIARQEAARAEASEDFLTSLFRVSDPGVNRGEELTARQLLDRGARLAQTDLRYPPALRARLLGVLADVHFSLGELDRTEKLLDAALAGNPDPTQRYSLQARRLWSLQRRGENTTAVALASDFIQAVPANAAFDVVRARTLNAAARAAAQVGDSRAADWQARAQASATRVGDAQELGNALRTLAFLQELKGKAADALRSTTDAIEQLRVALGDTAPEVFSARSNRAYLLGQIGEFIRAEREIDQLHSDASKVIGEDHIAMVYINVTRGMAYNDAGRTAAALRVLEDTSSRCDRVLGEDNFTCGSAVLGIADALLDLGRPADALLRLERLRADRRRTMGPDHIYTTYAEQRLARALCDLGRYVEGRALAVHVGARLAHELAPDSADRRQIEVLMQRCTK